MSPIAQDREAKQRIPEAARGLCWGGFFLNWIWSIGNSTWIGLLTLVPFVGIIMPFVLLFKGREWAWENKDWKSVEQFNSTQRVWSIIGILVVLFSFIPVTGILLAIAIPNFQRFQARAQQSEAKVMLASLYTAEMSMQTGGSFTADLGKLGIDTSHTKRYQIGFASSGPDFAKYCPECKADTKTFKAVAIGKIGPKEKLDVWTVDQDRNLVHVIDGI